MSNYIFIILVISPKINLKVEDDPVTSGNTRFNPKPKSIDLQM